MRDEKQMVNTVYIGYDEKEDTAYEVLKFSLERIATNPIRVVPIKKNLIERMGIYTRKSNMIHGQQYDEIDGRPFSTEFSFSRFLVPALNMYQGYALYMDCDMYIRADVNELFDMCRNSYYPLWCVKHKYKPEKGIKMDGKEQHPYPRKNWSSLMMFNCGHEVNESLHLKQLILNQADGYIHFNGYQIKKQT